MKIKKHINFGLTYFIISLILFTFLTIKIVTDFTTDDIVSVGIGMVLFFVFFFVALNEFFSWIVIRDGKIIEKTLIGMKSVPIISVARVNYAGQHGKNGNRIGFTLKDSRGNDLLRVTFRYLYTLEKKQDFLRLLQNENPKVEFDTIVSDIERGKNVHDLSPSEALRYVKREYEKIKNDANIKK